MHTCTCPTCQHEHTPPPVVDMTGHDEAVRELLHAEAKYHAKLAQAIEAALAGEVVEFPILPSDTEFRHRYYPGALYTIVDRGRFTVISDGGRRVIWTAPGVEQADA